MSVDILGTNCDQCLSTVQCCFTSTETVRLVRTESPRRPPQLSHSSWTLNSWGHHNCNLTGMRNFPVTLRRTQEWHSRGEQCHKIVQVFDLFGFPAGEYTAGVLVFSLLISVSIPLTMYLALRSSLSFSAFSSESCLILSIMESPASSSSPWRNKQGSMSQTKKN